MRAEANTTMLQVIQFEVKGMRLFGSLQIPASPCADRPGVLMLNSDDGCRLGPGNLWRRLADRLAEDGYASLRFDYRGCGDSEGPEESPSGAVALEDAIAAESLLRSQAGVSTCILVGICFGAEIALLACKYLPSVRGVVACSTGRYVSDCSYVENLTHARAYAGSYVRKLCRPVTWQKLLTGRVNYALICEGLAQRLSWSRWKRDRAGAVEARRLVPTSGRNGSPDSDGRPVPQLFIYGSADPLTARHMPRYNAEARQENLDRQFFVIPGADHNFSYSAWSEAAIGRIVEFVRIVS